MTAGIILSTSNLVLDSFSTHFTSTSPYSYHLPHRALLRYPSPSTWMTPEPQPESTIYFLLNSYRRILTYSRTTEHHLILPKPRTEHPRRNNGNRPDHPTPYLRTAWRRSTAQVWLLQASVPVALVGGILRLHRRRWASGLRRRSRPRTTRNHQQAMQTLSYGRNCLRWDTSTLLTVPARAGSVLLCWSAEGN